VGVVLGVGGRTVCVAGRLAHIDRSRRGRLEINSPLDQWLADLRALPELQFQPVTAGIAELAGSFDEAMPGDPADRIIVATALTLQTKLVTADERLRESPIVVTVW